MCMSPIELYYNSKEDKYQFYCDIKYCAVGDTIIVPCGKCPECRKKWRTQLAQRVRWEMAKHGTNKMMFLTLTFDEPSYNTYCPDGSLNHEPIKLFMKRLRRKLEYRGFTGKIKYLCAGEYGETTGRAHYHMILFGFKPSDLKFFGKSKKGYKTYKSEFINDCWKYGIVDIGEVTEHTAPYMVKYITKFSEISSDDFVVNGNHVRKPYIVYPKKILGIDFFLENWKQILNNGYILTSVGSKIGIPRSFLKYCEKMECINDELWDAYQEYKDRLRHYIYEDNKEYMQKFNLDSSFLIYEHKCKMGAIRREIYNSFKNVHR